jgi:hypothetical protein
MDRKHGPVLAFAPRPGAALCELVVLDQPNLLRKIQGVLAAVVAIGQRMTQSAIQNEVIGKLPIDAKAAQRPFLCQEKAISLTEEVFLLCAWVIAPPAELVGVVD